MLFTKWVTHYRLALILNKNNIWDLVYEKATTSWSLKLWKRADSIFKHTVTFFVSLYQNKGQKIQIWIFIERKAKNLAIPKDSLTQAKFPNMMKYFWYWCRKFQMSCILISSAGNLLIYRFPLPNLLQVLV